jgi:hypothetical protein
MKPYIVWMNVGQLTYTWVEKLVAILLLGALVSVFSLPGEVSGAGAGKKAKEASLILNSQNNVYPSIANDTQTGLDITGDMTIAMWVKPLNLVTDKILVSKWQHTEKTSYLLYFVDTNLSVSLSAVGRGYDYRTFSVPYPKNLNEWSLITMVYTAASGTVEFFIDGASAGKSADFAMPTSIANTDAAFMIGTRENRDVPFVGNIDDVRIWSRTLSGTEVNQLYKHPKKFSNGAALQGYWKFNGNFNDESGNGNSLGVSFSSDVPY